jgi:hypothetical protein
MYTPAACARLPDRTRRATNLRGFRNMFPANGIEQHAEGSADAQALASMKVEEAWFDAPPSSTRRSSAPPPPVEKVGEFVGDPMIDAWLR